MTKIDIFSGFLGAGKTTLIKKLINEAYKGEKIVLIENEFGEIGIDGGFLQDAGITINEMNSGCICCSLVGDFSEALKKVIDEYAPDRILIEPSGVGKLSDVIRAVQSVMAEGVELNAFTTVADVNKCKMYMKNFGEFYNDQIENASAIILSHTQTSTEKKIEECIALLREHNADAIIMTTPWDELEGTQILAAMEEKTTLEAELERLKAYDDDEDEHEHHHHHHDDDDDDEDEHEHHHHHHDDDDDDEDEHEHHHHHHDDDDDDEDDEDEHEHHHHHHDDDDDEDEHEHEHEHHHHHHHHDHDGHHHHHHHHHHADDVFDSWGIETAKKFDAEQITAILKELENEEKYGAILRSKGIVAGNDGKWIHFDYVPGEPDVRNGSAAVIGRICVIGSKINEKAISELFGI